MNRRQRQAWLQDVRLAARFGDPEVLDAALEGLRQHPAVAANRALPPDLVQRVLVPAGQALAAGPVSAAYLRSLAASPYAAYRALAAAAWGTRYARGRAAPDALLPLAADPRPEVRDALQAVLAAAPRARQAALVRAWLTPGPRPRSPRAVALAWALAPAVLSPAAVWDHAEAWAARDEAAALRPAIVAALQAVAARAPDLALQRLQAGRLPPPWRAQVLAGAWAAARAPDALALLRALYVRYGRRRWLTQALRALARAGALDDDVDAVLRAWEAAGS